LPGDVYEENTVRINSRGFLVTRPATSPEKNDTRLPVARTDMESKPKTIDTGSKVAIALGVVLGVFALVGIGAFISLRKKVNKVIVQMPDIASDALEKDGVSRHELEGNKVVHELPSDFRMPELEEQEGKTDGKGEEHIEIQEIKTN
jgi:hypothetical protein